MNPALRRPTLCLLALAPACAARTPIEVGREIVGRVEGVPIVPPEEIAVYPRFATPPPVGVDRIAWLRAKWDDPEDLEAVRRALFEEASRFGADVILDYEERPEGAERRPWEVSPRPLAPDPRTPYEHPGVIHGTGGPALAFTAGFLTLAALTSVPADRPPPERGTILGCAARTRSP